MRQVRVRRWLVGAMAAAVVALPSAAWIVGSKVNDTSERTEDLARLTRQVRVLTLRTNHDAQITTVALCTFRSDLETLVANSRAFLAKHPHGIPGISAKDIRTSIANRQRTIKALSILDCA